MAQEIADVLVQKQKAYGSSFFSAGAALRLLFPNGIPPEQYEFVCFFTRSWDKMARRAVNNDPFGENPMKDLNGYCLLMLKQDAMRQSPPSSALDSAPQP